MSGDDFCTDREPESRSVASLGRKERFQNLPLNFCWNSWTCVRDLYIEAVHCRCGGKTHDSPVWHRIDCIADQICEALPDLTFQANDGRHIVQPLPLNGYVGSAQRALKEGQRRFEEFWNRNGSGRTLLPIESQGMRRNGRDPF